MNTSTGGRRNDVGDEDNEDDDDNTQKTRNRKRKGGSGGADRNNPLTKWFLKRWSYKDHKFNNKWPEWKKDHWRVVKEAQKNQEKKSKKYPTKAEKVVELKRQLAALE